MEVKEQRGPIVIPPTRDWNDPRLVCYDGTCRCVHSAMHDGHYPYCGAQTSRRDYINGSIWTLIRRMDDSRAGGCPLEDETSEGTIMTWDEKVEMVNLSQFAGKYGELMAFITARIADVDNQGLEMVISVVEVTPARVQEHADAYRKIVERYIARGEVYSYKTELRVQLIRATLTGLAMRTPEMATFEGWKAVYDTMTDREKTFVRQVRDNDSCKIGIARYQEDGVPAVWERPEALGLVTCVGSYKWHCTAPDALLGGVL